MRLLVIEPPSRGRQGDQVHRVDAPLSALTETYPVYARAGCWLSQATRKEAEICDLLILCQSVDFDFLALVARRRARGLLTLFELNDDFLGATREHAVFSFWQMARTQSTAFALMRQADGLQFSSIGLQKKFGFLNTQHRVFPNAMPAANLDVEALLGAKDAHLRVGWGGSLAHKEDVTAMLPALASLMQKYPSWTLCVMAPHEAHLWFRALPTARCSFYVPGSFDTYLAFCRTLHVGLAPLCDSVFNRSRSDGKCVEYAASGAAIVAQAHPTFDEICVAEETALAFTDTESLERAIARLLTSACLRARLVRRAHEYVRLRRDPTALADARMAFYRSLCAEVSDADVARLAGHAQTRARGTFALVEMTCADAQILSGLESEDDEEAIIHFGAAAHMAPAHPLAYLYRACRRPRGDERTNDLHRARALCPKAASHASLLLAEDAICGGDALAAAATLARMGDLPESAWGWELRGRLCLLEGDVGSALSAWEKALARDCDHRPALYRAIEQHIARAEIAQAEVLWERGRQSLLATPAEQALFAKLFFDAGRPRAARRCFAAPLGPA